MAFIATFESYFGTDSDTGELVTLEAHAARFPNSVRDVTPPAAELERERTTEARVSGGVWVASCPEPDCRGVEMVRFSDGLFFCCECRNAGVGHRPLKVKLPTEKQRAAIETVLGVRPVPGTRNWTPDESVKQLRTENEEHGLETR